jgi:phosphatidate cytidylyltransferase
VTKRIVTAFALVIILAIALIFVSSFYFKFLVLGFVLICLNEFHRIVLPNSIFYRLISTIYGLLIAAKFLFPSVLPLPMLAWVVIGFFIVTLLFMVKATALEGIVLHIGYAVFGVVYLSFTIPFLSLLRDSGNGVILIILAVGMPAVGDAMAFFVGRAIGRHKLAPLVSPNKTIEGLGGAVIGSVAFILVLVHFLWPEFPQHHAIILGVLIGLVGAMGDLIESLIKRNFHVKDSGSLLPGHGGLLDRADAWIFSAPAIYFYMLSIGYL